MKQIFLSFLAVLTLGGCATSAKQTEAFYREPHRLPSRQEIEAVPFIDQEVGYCGPATLSMVLQYWGDSTSQQALASQVYTPDMKGSLQTDLISATRRKGYLAIPITGIQSLLTEIAHGHPVIIFENLGLDWMPQWHYAVVNGFDYASGTLFLRSGL
ncbi:MAG: PA2778 family cysteine peptidase, partial [Pseudobdellovibrionaceae bacterium]